MASSSLSVCGALSDSEDTLQAAKQLLTKANRDALSLHQTSEQMGREVDNVRSKFEKTLADISMVVQQPFLDDEMPVSEQFSNLFKAYGLLREVVQILRSTVTDQTYINDLNRRFNIWLIDMMQNKLMVWLSGLVMQLGPTGNPQLPSMRTVLDIFHKCVYHIKNGPLENWRREQKRSMLGIKVKPNELTEAVQLLQIAQKGFKTLMRIWQQLYQVSTYSTDSTTRNRAVSDCKALLKHLLQSSFIVEWSMCGCGERRQQHIRDGTVCRKKLQPPTVISRSAAVDEDKVTVIPKLLAVNEEVRQNFRVRFNLQFVRPAGHEISAVNEEIAIKLRDDIIDDGSALAALERGGKINGVNELSEEGIALADGSLGNEFTNLLYCMHKKDIDYYVVNAENLAGITRAILCLNNDKRAAPNENGESPPAGRIRADKRKAETKYHMHVTAQVNFLSSADYIELKTISMPFMISVNAQQYSQNTRAMFWSILSSASESVTFADDDKATVIWGDMSEAIKWMFYTLTGSRELRDDEVDHIGYQIYKLANPNYKGSEFKPPLLMQVTRADIQNTSLRHGDVVINQRESSDAQFSFWDWYFSAIEMVDDRSLKYLPKRMAPTDPEWGTMAGLFKSGVIYGFIGRDAATRILHSVPDNAMLIRFSDHFCAGLTIFCRRRGSLEEVIEHVPLTRQLLMASGLPVLLGKLTQLEGIDEIASYDRHQGPTWVAKRDLVGSQGPNVRLKGEYMYANPSFFVIGAAEQDRSPQPQPQPQPQRSLMNDDQLRSWVKTLKPEEGVRLAAMLQERLFVKDAPVATAPPANRQPNHVPPATAHFSISPMQQTAHIDGIVAHQPSPQEFRHPPPYPIEQAQPSNQNSVIGSNGLNYASLQSFHGGLKQQPAGFQPIQNGRASSSQHASNYVQLSGQQTAKQARLYNQSEQPYLPTESNYQSYDFICKM